MIELLTGTSIQQTHSPTNQIAPQDSTDGLMHLLHIIGEFYAEGIDDHLMVALLLFVIIYDIYRPLKSDMLCISVQEA